MTDSIFSELEKLRSSLAGLQAQRGILADSIIEPAIEALKDQIIKLEDRLRLEQSDTHEQDRDFSKQKVATKQIREERRIVTILFSDIVGSTAIAEKLDPEDWRELIGKIHELGSRIIHDRQGNVLQYLGDGLLAVFGIKGMSERDPENALRAALEFQNDLGNLNLKPKILVRIGIHTGLVVAGEIGSDAKKEFAAMGDAMNLAARIQSIAPPGGVLISQDTYRYIRGVFELETQPLVMLKGKSEPIQTYRVIKARPHPFRSVTRGVAGLFTRTVGRDDEIDQISKAIHSVLTKNGALWVQLIGEPGVGKSRLVDEAALLISDCQPSFMLFKARVLQGDENQPYTLVRRLWFDYLQITDEASSQEIETKWIENMQSLTKDDDAVIALGLLLGISFSFTERLARIKKEPEEIKARAIILSRQVLNFLCSQSPIAFLLEDIHWADPASLDYLAAVLNDILENSTSNSSIFILGTARPEFQPPELLRKQIRTLFLNPLDENATTQLAQTLLGKVTDLPEDVLTTFIKRCEGFPYYLEELVNWLIDHGVLDITHDPWKFIPQNYEMNPLPQSLQALLLNRLLSLSPEERLLLQHGAIFGRDFWEGGLEVMGDKSPSEHLVGLQPRRFVEAQTQSMFPGEIAWSFHHNLLYEVTYESILKRERKILHQVAAEWLFETAQQANKLMELSGFLGDHFYKAGETQKAAEWFACAGEFAYQRAAYKEALYFYTRTLDSLPQDAIDLTWQALIGRSEVNLILGEIEARCRDDEKLMEIALSHENLTWLAQAYYRVGYRLSQSGDEHSAIANYQKGIQAAKQTGDQNIEAQLLGVMVPSLVRLGRLDEAKKASDEALRIAYVCNDEETFARTLVNTSFYYSTVGDFNQAIQILNQQVEICNRNRLYIGEMIGRGNLGYYKIIMGYFSEGLADLYSSLELSEALGVLKQSAYTRLNIGLGLWREGNYAFAIDEINKAIVVLKDKGDTFGCAAGWLYLGLVYESIGLVDRALENYSQARSSFLEMGISSSSNDALAGMARVNLTIGQKNTASEYVQELEKSYSKGGWQGMEFPSLAFQSCVLVFNSFNEKEKALEFLNIGYQDLLSRADKIENPLGKASFLHQIPEHRWFTQQIERHQV